MPETTDTKTHVGNLSPLEKAWIAIKRFNEQEPKREVNWCRRIGRLKITYRWRSKNCLWGRFGGGWNWELGVQVGGHTAIINLLVCSIRIEIANAEVTCDG